ncbi:sialidase family protein [Brachyspira pilosicoli]|uniref:sialidase family protein n=1 Tax=Brachyspira pilosicoli TaxID=52584 RepID=UPI00300624E6
MSKKIIYLLSLLMALSLVFASCKKNGAGDISGPGPGDNGFDNSPTTDTGLADSSDWLEANSQEPIKNDEIPNFQTTGGVAYFRNPVVVVMGAQKNHVAVFAEKRYLSSGSANDIGVDGKTATDIVCIISKDSGKTWGLPQIIGRTGAEEATADNAVASPVVFKVDDTTVVVVASAGVGLSRANQIYGDRGKTSQLMYTKATYNENSGFTWSTWKDMTSSIETEVNNAASGTSLNYKQFAVHSGRGVVNGGNLFLAVTIADQGKDGADNEAMGNIIFYASSGNLDTWTKVGDAVKFDTSASKKNYSVYKESRVIEATGTSPNNIQYIAVGNPYSNPVHNIIGHGSQAGQNATDSQIVGSEGSPSYLVVDKWYGSKSYDPTTYSTANNATDGTPAEKQRLFAHVKSRNSTITMYGLQEANFAQDGTKSYTVKAYPTDTTTLAKSSSMDVLGDGTIIMAAEQGGSEKAYKVVFKRFTQKFLATQLGL